MRLNCMFQTSPLSRLIKTSPATHLCWNVYARKKGKNQGTRATVLEIKLIQRL